MKREYFYEGAEDDLELESDGLEREGDDEDEEPTDPSLIEAARERLKRKRAKQTGWVGAPDSGHRIALDMLRKAFPNPNPR